MVDEKRKKVWAVELHMLEAFDEVCKKYGLTFPLDTVPDEINKEFDQIRVKFRLFEDFNLSRSSEILRAAVLSPPF